MTARSDASIYGPFRTFLCGGREPGRDDRLTVRRLIRRNAVEDMALASSLEAKLGKDDLRAEILRRAGARDAAVWCRSPLAASELGAEWYLKVRDWLYSR